MAKFSVRDQISLPADASAVNEDSIGHTDCAIWVIDGATGVLDRPSFAAGMTDAAWLASTLTEQLEDTFSRGLSDPASVLGEIADLLAQSFAEIPGASDIPASEQPSAALAMAVLDRANLHLIGIGDCRVLYKLKHGRTELFEDLGMGDAEKQILLERQRLLDTFPAENPWPKLKPFIQSLRERTNKENGYSGIHPTRKWLTTITHKVVSAMDVEHVMVLSDGMYRAIDVFRFSSAEALLQQAMEEGLLSSLRRIRNLEEQDLQCRQYPRVKASDDASAVLASIVAE